MSERSTTNGTPVPQQPHNNQLSHTRRFVSSAAVMDPARADLHLPIPSPGGNERGRVIFQERCHA